VWKFQGDRLSHLGDIAPQSATKKKEKKTTAKHKPTWNYRSGWPKNNMEHKQFANESSGCIFILSAVGFRLSFFSLLPW